MNSVPQTGTLSSERIQRQRADVILVAVREDNSPHTLAILGEIRNVRNYDIYPEQFSLREHEPRIDNDDVVAPADGHAVHTELAEAPKRNDLQFSSWHLVNH